MEGQADMPAGRRRANPPTSTATPSRGARPLSHTFWKTRRVPSDTMMADMRRPKSRARLEPGGSVPTSVRRVTSTGPALPHTPGFSATSAPSSTARTDGSCRARARPAASVTVRVAPGPAPTSARAPLTAATALRTAAAAAPATRSRDASVAAPPPPLALAAASDVSEADFQSVSEGRSAPRVWADAPVVAAAASKRRSGKSRRVTRGRRRRRTAGPAPAPPHAPAPPRQLVEAVSEAVLLKSGTLPDGLAPPWPAGSRMRSRERERCDS